MLPTFLGIGAPKSGTSWLHDLLASHPDVWMAQRREVHYFDRHYDRGLDWYRKFFPPDRHDGRYVATGEITPHYMYHAQGAERIAGLPSVRRLIVLLRNPVDRAYSHYWFRVRIENFTGSFEEFLAQRPEATDWGFYARHLRNYVRRFDKDRFSVLIFERAFENPDETLRLLGDALGIDSGAFPAEVTGRRVNPRFVPRYRRLYALSFSAARWLVRRDFHGVVRWARTLSIMRVLGKQGGAAIHTPMEAATRDRLSALFAEDIEELETMFDLDVSTWRRRES